MSDAHRLKFKLVYTDAYGLKSVRTVYSYEAACIMADNLVENNHIKSYEIFQELSTRMKIWVRGV